MKLWRWKAEAGMYTQGKFDYFIFRGSALKWLKEYKHYDILCLTDRWSNKKTYFKDRLYGRADTPKATIIMNPGGRVEIIYNNKEVTNADL